MIDYDYSPAVETGLLSSWSASQFQQTGFESRTDLGGAASGSSRFCESYLDSSTSEMMAGGNDFPRSGSTNALTRVASGTQLSHAGSATNLLNLSAIACQSGQRSQYEESSDASTQALQRSLSQLKLAQQQGACGLGPLQEDCRAEIDRANGDLPQGVEALGRLDCIMGGVSQSTYPTFPSARSAPAGPSSSNGDSFTGSIIRNAVPGLPHSASQQSLAFSAIPEVNSRSVLVSNLDPKTTPEQLQEVFQEHGDLRSLYTGVIDNGVVIISYYDLRASALAVNFLNGRPLNGRPMSVKFHEPEKGSKDVGEGVVSLLSMDENLPDENVLAIVTAYGDVKMSDVKFIEKHPSIRNCRLVTFYDVRHAEAAYQKINANPPRVPTISEDPQDPHPNGTGPQALQDWRSQSWDLHLQSSNSSDPLLNMMGGNSGGLQGPYEGSQPNLRMLQHSNSSTSISALQEAHAYQADMLRAQVLASHASGSNLHVPSYIRPAGGLGMGTSASHPNLSSILAAPSSPAQPSTGNGVQHAGLASPMSANELALLGLASPALTEHAPLRNRAVSTGNLADLYSQPVKGLRGTGSASTLYGAGIGENLFLGQQYSGGVLGQLQGLNLDNLGAAGAGWGPAQRHLQDQTVLAQQCLQSLLNNPALVGSVAFPALSRGLASGRGDPRMRVRRDDERGMANRIGRGRHPDPAAEAERKLQQERMYALDPDKVKAGEDPRSTLMIKNIPNKYTQKMLLSTIDAEFKGTYDFFYLPIDFKNKCNVGYAFINMVDTKFIVPLYERFNNKKWEKFNSEKICHITYARIQGKANLVTHFQNSSLLHEDKRCRPVLFHVSGEPEPFPTGPSTKDGLRASRSTGCVDSSALPH